MIKTCRLDIPYSETESMEFMLEKTLASVGLTIQDIKVEIHAKNKDNFTHYGNWVLVPVKYLPELEKLNIDMEAFILESSDIDSFEVGQKVRLQYTGGWASQVFEEGTIYKKGIQNDLQYIDILKKGTKSGKGWRLFEGDSAAIFAK